MKVSTVSIKTIHPESFRIDPSFHLSEAIALRKELEKVPYGNIAIKDVTEKVFLGNIFSRIFVKDKEHGVPYLAASDTVLADHSTGRFIANKQAKELSYLMLKKDWIVITCSGTIGNVTYTNSTFENHIATHDLIRVIPNDNIIKKGCLYAYLSSKYGYNQLTQSRFGGVVKHINADHVNNITVPKFPDSFQNEVDDLIQESSRLREEAKSALDSAHKILSDNIIIISKSKKIGAVSVKDIVNSHLQRFDGQYHISDGKEIDEIIRTTHTWKSLGEITKSISRPDICKRTYVKDGITFFGGTDIFLSVPDSKKKMSSKIPNIKDYIIDEGWILLPRSGTIGDVVFTTSQHAQKLVSEDVIRIIPNDILSGGYIYAFLSSKIGKSLIQRPIFGSVIQHVEPPHLSLIPIPILEDNIMNEISLLAQEHRIKWGKAAKMEIQAISMVEQEIEKWYN